MRGSSSASSRRSHRRYHTTAPNSQVDETLFGSPNPLDKRGSLATSAPKNQPQKKQEGETIQLVTKDLIRNLRIPFKDPSGESIILPLSEFERITSTSRVLTKEEREALKEAYQRKKDEEIRATEERKRQIHEADLSRKENKALTELELEARDRAQALLERANALRMEQEEEIKQFNLLILGAQCQATRDFQIHEKKQIQAELSEEEKRLDAGMEVERRKALETVEQIDELRKQQRIRGRQQICDQIQQHLEEKQMEDEAKEQEKQQTREKLEKMNLEDLKALEKKREEQQRLQEEIMSMNTKAVRAKEQRREEEKLADLRDKEYTRKKMERDAEHEEEQRRIKKEKELEIARLRARQEKAKDYKADQDELRARRNQEASDREWRRKEKELSAKKGQEKEVLMAALMEQIHCKDHHLSIEAGREKAEFERVLKAQQEAIIKQKEEEEKQRQKALRHADSIRTQVKEHVISAMAKRRETFKEADQMMEEARLRRIRLDEIKERKLKELKATGLPEKYCSEVERKGRTCAL
ncbi:cilia- and flagella-associated protein 45 [Sebastes umbrosus]|uniref:cilia- and flagella-associated protein 45 n=1 Tax=Sebastes umbrosus TaxID=72105 RepID=UPI0018A040F2|nr:cilia- and flagella-associated protein 45 [Sebastes umbrosus]